MEYFFSFNITINQNVPIQQYFSTNWSKEIDAALYKENENYRVFIRFHYEGKNNTIVEECIGPNINTQYEKLDTKYWACFNSTSSDPELINVKKICDGIPDCADSSDETEALCKPKYSHFEYILLCVAMIFVFLGIFTFLVVQKASNVVNNNENDHAINLVNVTTEIIDICVESRKENYRKHKGLDPRTIQKIRQIYTPCQNNEEKKHVFKLLFTLSLNEKIKNFVWQIVDEMIKIEQEKHNTKGEAINCMRFCRDDDSYLSAFIKDVFERYEFFTKLGRKTINCLTFDCGSLGLYMKVSTQVSMSLLHLGLFYYDIVKDIIVLYILSYVENAILRDADLKTKFDTVGGINFQLLVVYLALVLVISEAAIYCQINNRKDMFEKTFNIDPNSRVCRTFVNMFPMHFIFLQKCAVDIKVLFFEEQTAINV